MKITYDGREITPTVWSFDQSLNRPPTATINIAGDFVGTVGSEHDIVLSIPATLPVWKAWIYRTLSRWLPWPKEIIDQRRMIVTQITRGAGQRVELEDAAAWELRHRVVE